MKLSGENVLIYGTGGNGIKVCTALKDKCNVLGFLDKRFSEISNLNGMSVYNPMGTIDNIEIGNCVVIVTVKNVFAHNSIVEKLIEHGYRYFVFKSSNALKNCLDDNERLIDDLYESIVEKNIVPDIIEIPCTDVLVNRLRERLLIQKKDDRAIAYCPIEILYNYEKNDDFRALCMPLFFPIVDLYLSFLCVGEQLGKSSDNYITYCGNWANRNGICIGKSQRESMIESRVGVFEELQLMTEVDSEFFLRNTPAVEYKQGKFFLCSSGRNRICFLISKGHKYVPVNMSLSDYDKWLKNASEYAKITQGGIDGGTEFFAPIPNPLLVDAPTVFVDYQRLFLIPIAKRLVCDIFELYIAENNQTSYFETEKAFDHISKTKVWVCANDNNIAASFFLSVGFSVTEEMHDADVVVINGATMADNNIDIDSLKAEVYYLDYAKNIVGSSRQSETLFIAPTKRGFIKGERFIK